MKLVHARDFTADQAWGAVDIALMDDVSVRLHWTDQPYQWHVNDGQEVFVVLDGCVDMHYRDGSGEHVVRLTVGDIFHAGLGDEHVAHPIGAARILVIERAGSI